MRIICVRKATTIALLLVLLALPAVTYAANGLQQDPGEDTLAFTTEIAADGQGFGLYGTFKGLSAKMAAVTPMYSFDGANWKVLGNQENQWNLNLDFDSQSQLEKWQTQRCAYSTDQPFVRYLAGTLDEFYVKLRIDTKDGNRYSTKPSLISRGNPSLLPENVSTRQIFPKNMHLKNGRFTEGVYQITVLPGASKEEVRKLLPDTLPMEVQIYSSEGAILGTAAVECPVDWLLPEEAVYKDYKSLAAIPEMTAPRGTHIKTQSAIYVLDRDLNMQMPLRLYINVAADNTQIFELHHGRENAAGDSLAMTFPLKPSGAKKILSSYSLDGGRTWIGERELLPQKKGIDAVPKNPHYSDVALYQQTEAPYKEYAEGDIDGFLVKVCIDSGVFDGWSQVKKWPADYQYVPPLRDPQSDGSVGNNSNVGANNNTGNSSLNGGQRPGLQEDMPANMNGSEKKHKTSETPLPFKKTALALVFRPQEAAHLQDKPAKVAAVAAAANPEALESPQPLPIAEKHTGFPRPLIWLLLSSGIIAVIVLTIISIHDQRNLHNEGGAHSHR